MSESLGSLNNTGRIVPELQMVWMPTPLTLCRFHVPLRSGPGPGDPSSMVWLYHSHVDEVADTYAGLVGALVVTAKGKADKHGRPRDVDVEVFTYWSVVNENLSGLYDKNSATVMLDLSADGAEEEFEESNLMHALNGYVYGNMPEIVLFKGQRVRWYVFALGTEVDLHTPHWHGQSLLHGGHRVDVVNLLPATQLVVDMVPDNVGQWLMHCHVNDHISAGMVETFTVIE
jgi:manganese oxidase